MPTSPTPPWREQYGNAEAYAWKTATDGGNTKFYRPLGLVEYAFDSDGRYYEGRADLNVQLDLVAKSNISTQDLRHRILLAWTLFQFEHPLAQSKAVERRSYMSGSAVTTQPIYSVVDVPKDENAAIAAAKDSLVFLGDHFTEVDPYEFWVHAQNTARVIDPSQCLSKCFVFPLNTNPDGTLNLRFLLILGHQIADGLTNYTWMRSFVHILNKSLPDLHTALRANTTPTSLLSRLPPPQESLYPLITGSPARKRWFWLLTRILRHVRTPHPAGFANPLRRPTPSAPLPYPPTFAPVLSYTRLPRLNTLPVFARASLPATSRLSALCRSAGVSVGAGCFALAALSMMEFNERADPSVPLSARKPFITGFPLNPRPFLREPIGAESLMLAFSDGIELPFLPSRLPLEGRIRLLARRAQAQLAVYQKREARAAETRAEKLAFMGSRGPGRMLATQYVSSIERAAKMLPEGEVEAGPQGAYAMRPNATVQTCGVSSVGKRAALIGRGMYDFEEEGRDFVADFWDMKAAVRAREGEFLIGVEGAEDGLSIFVSADASAMDPGLVKEWQGRLGEMFEELEKEGTKGRASL
ncbi:hypothetical protein WHR41_00794 [Cladosporium halotolerans]|uniref:Uncharacterized protein n=1 Tax=Cladosporium halotolerans TaxID=1052096 RepID=A0AB34L3T3_9PEZI